MDFEFNWKVDVDGGVDIVVLVEDDAINPPKLGFIIPPVHDAVKIFGALEKDWDAIDNCAVTRAKELWDEERANGGC
jgi:hypothetical protein